MGNLFKQKVTIVVAFGILSLVIFFASLAIYTNTLNEELNNYNNKVLDYISSLMYSAQVRNENVIDYALADKYFDDSYDNILSKARQDDYISTVCKEIKALVPSIQSVLAIMESGEVYKADDTFDSYFEQFKNVKNSELYKDTCLENTFTVNKYNKYYNVECYSYSNAIFDKSGQRVGTFITTYSLDGHWNDINSFNKDDFSGTVIFETFDKQVLSIIDANGVERYNENELLGERAYDILDDSKIVSTYIDNDKEYKMYFVANDEIILDQFELVRVICIVVVIVILVTIIILTNRRKDKYFFEIAMITGTSIVVFIVIWLAFVSTYYEIEGMAIKINSYSDEFLCSQYETSFKRGVDAFSDYVQTTLLKDVDTKAVTTREFASLFATRTLENSKTEYINVRKHFLFEKEMKIYVDENRRVNFESNKIEVPDVDEKTNYNKLVKSADNELSTITREGDSIMKTVYYKVRMLSKYTIVYSIKYNLGNFYENNTSERFNVNELGESYFVDYNDGFKIALIRSNEIAAINNIEHLEYVDSNEDIFGGNLKKMIEKDLNFATFNQVGSLGNRNIIACINKRDLKRIEVYFVKEETLITLRYSMIVTLIIEFGLFGTLILYNYLETRRIKRKDKKEEIVLHGNY